MSGICALETIHSFSDGQRPGTAYEDEALCRESNVHIREGNLFIEDYSLEGSLLDVVLAGSAVILSNGATNALGGVTQHRPTYAVPAEKVSTPFYVRDFLVWYIGKAGVAFLLSFGRRCRCSLSRGFKLQALIL